MKYVLKVAIMLVALVMILPSLTAEASSYRQVKQVSGSSLVVKASPNTQAATVATLKRGDFVTVFSTSNGWASIQTKGISGYVNASYLGNAPSTIKIANSKSGLVVKANPSRSAKTLATLKYNMIVEDFGSVGAGWSFVQYGNVTGYVVSTFIGTPKTTTQYVNSKSGVVVRNIASPSGANVGSLTNETAVKVHSTIAGWSYVTVGNTKGYVVASALSAKKPVKQVTGGLVPTELSYVRYDLYDESGRFSESKSGSVDMGYYAGSASINWYDNPYMPFLMFEPIKNGFIWGVGDYYESLTYPLYEGKSWTSRPYDDNFTQSYKVMSIGKVTVAAGTFENVVRLRITYNQSPDVRDTYFAPGYGIIRLDIDGKRVYELAYAY